jgi:hypothetical protein
MSNLKPVLIKDPRIIVDNERFFGVLKSGLRLRQKPWTTNSVSTSNIPFSTPAPSFDIFIDRRISLSLPIRLTITCNCAPGYAPLNPNYDAPRAFPAHSMLNTLTLTVNNATVTQYIGEIIHPLLHLNNGDSITEYDYSQCPSALDNVQNYSDLVGSIGNVLSSYGDSNQGSIMGRGGFSGYVIVENPVNNTLVNADMTAIVDILSIEQLMFSPLEFGNLQENSSAFYNVSTMDWQFNFLNNAANRVWSHANSNNSLYVSSSVQFSNFINPGGFAFGSEAAQPLLFINYITPDPVISKMYLQKPISYPYFPVSRYVTSTNNAIAYNDDPQVITSNNIQLSNIPKKLIIFARETNNVYYSSPVRTDSFYGIDKVTVQFQNYGGLLSESTKPQLYQLSRKNHCNIPWSQWSGQGQYPVGGAEYGEKFGGVGSILVLEMGTDIQLDPEYAPGSIGQFNLVVQATVRNIDPSLQHDTSPVDLYILTVSDGIFTIPSGGVAFSELSVLTTKDVIEANMQTNNDGMYLNYNDLQEVNGGNFYTGLKNFGNVVGKKIKDANQYLRKNKTISDVSGKIAKATDAPLIRDIPYIDYANKLARDVHDISSALGYGAQGGSVLGAGKMSKNKLKNRLRNV